MREKHALWISAANGIQGIVARTELKAEAMRRWNMVAICERFGWRPEDYYKLPVDLLQDIIAICSIRDRRSSK